MKITRSREPVITLGENNKKNFSVNLTDSKFFRVMSDTLYSDKVGSIIRELACNAVDSHRLSGNKAKPFQVFLPCLSNPKFCIRDFGTGLSPEQIEAVYTSYFESTKDGNNDDIGGFGLGAKTPFSYTDSFVVRSYIGGKLYTYTMSFSGDTPEYNLHKIEETEQENGLEVFFDVAPEDFEEFNQKAFAIFIWLDCVPDVWTASELNNGFFHTEKMENYREDMSNYLKKNAFEDENIFILSAVIKNSFGKNTKIKRVNVLQGGILYPIKQSISPKIKKLSNTIGYQDSVVIKCDIGDISLTPSRESIEESKDNIKTIENKINKMLDKSNELAISLFSDKSVSKFKMGMILSKLLSSERTFFSESFFRNKNIIDEYYLNTITELNEGGRKKYLNDLFFNRYGETYSSFQTNHTKYIDISKLFESDKFSAYTTRVDLVNHKKFDVKNGYFSTKGFRKVWFMCRDDYEQKTNDLIKYMSKSSHQELVLVFDTFKTKVKKSIFDNKKDYVKNMMNQMLNFIEADEGDFNIVYESDIIKAHSLNKDPVEESGLLIYYNFLQQKMDVTTNFLRISRKESDFDSGRYVYVMKNGNECSFKSNKSGKKIKCSRQLIVNLVNYAKVMMKLDFKGLLVVNETEIDTLRAVNKNAEYVPLGVALSAEQEKYKRNAKSNLNKLKGYVELAHFKEFFDVYLDSKNKVKSLKMLDLVVKLLKLLGDKKSVENLDYLIKTHQNKIFNNFEVQLNKEIGLLPSPIIPLVSPSGIVQVATWHLIGTIENMQEMGLRNNWQITREIFPDGFTKEIIDYSKDFEKIKDCLSIKDFINDENTTKFPLLKSFRNLNKINCEETLVDLIEYIEFKNK